MSELIELKAPYAAEMIKSMGGVAVRVMVNDLGEAAVEAIEPGDLSELQDHAERLLRHLQRRYRIVQA
jgi:hypothetical protein